MELANRESRTFHHVAWKVITVGLLIRYLLLSRFIDCGSFIAEGAGLLESNDIHRWFDWLEHEQSPTCIFGFGESMGAAQILQSLQGESRFCGVAAESAFSNFQEIDYDRIGQFFKAGPWLGRTILRPVVKAAFGCVRLKYRLNLKLVSPQRIASITRVPILLIHGRNESNIPIRHSHRIAETSSTVALWEVPDTDHCGAIQHRTRRVRAASRSLVR